ncbi:hypothetical protein K2173_003476 [Erythroxylum novogranatense]|uniref:Late embryogenesis abundant protein LEA-2 subgroup domain-containing protein n=1 Tax=Erythroxylum novogranatense TaxID=1862640 RepID=A0AAV8S961_9ROSI|nr:hypothetical protein K2173_003476 [Erythroxylum novogranatense]
MEEPGFHKPRGSKHRKPALPTSYQPRKKGRGCCRICCCCLCVLLVVVILLILILCGFFYLWSDPKLPVFRVLSFNIPNFNVTDQPDGAYLDAATVGQVEVKNPNSKIKINYGESNVQVTIGNSGIPIGTTRLPEFTQGANSATNLKIETSVKNKLIGGKGSAIVDQFQSKTLIVNVKVDTEVGLSVGGLKTAMTDVHVLCEGMTLKQIEDGEPPKCKINALKWLNL